jgi:hypothetical protein
LVRSADPRAAWLRNHHVIRKDLRPGAYTDCVYLTLGRFPRGQRRPAGSQDTHWQRWFEPAGMNRVLCSAACAARSLGRAAAWGPTVLASAAHSLSQTPGPLRHRGRDSDSDSSEPATGRVCSSLRFCFERAGPLGGPRLLALRSPSFCRVGTCPFRFPAAVLSWTHASSPSFAEPEPAMLAGHWH